MVAISRTREAPEMAPARLAALGILVHWVFLPLGLALHAALVLLQHIQKFGAYVPGRDIPFWDIVDRVAASVRLLLNEWQTVNP